MGMHELCCGGPDGHRPLLAGGVKGGDGDEVLRVGLQLSQHGGVPVSAEGGDTDLPRGDGAVFDLVPLHRRGLQRPPADPHAVQTRLGYADHSWAQRLRRIRHWEEDR
ncbi:hypothetical protein COCON_G00141420, partial [Conger conger]